MIGRTHRRTRATRDSAGRLILLAPRRHRGVIALAFAGAVGVTGFLIGQHALQHATAAIPVGSPFGHVDSVVAVPGGVTVTGWTIDPTTPQAAITAAVYSDGKLVTSAVASGNRPDVATANPTAGPDHGFVITALVPEGTHQICTSGLNVGQGANRQLDCRSMTLRYRPYGVVDQFSTTPGHVVVRGWTLDSDSPSTALSVYVTIDGTRAATLLANLDRPDLPAPYVALGGGTLHGYAGTIAMPQGTHTVCAIAKNVRYGADVTIRCATLTLADSPVVHLDSAHQVAGGYYLRGWAFDPNAPATPLTMTVVADGKLISTFTANAPRSDVAATYPSAGPNHGFTAKYNLAQGSHSICMSAVNISYGYNRHLICGTITLNFNPTAAITAVSSSRYGAIVSGWATDPDTAAPINVNVYADGRYIAQVPANGTVTGHAGHGFSKWISPLPSGSHKICAVGVNAYYGTGNSPMVCSWITLTLSPIGAFNSVTRANGSTALVVSGWAADPDAGAGPINVSITVDGKAYGVTANRANPASAASYAFLGTSHGYVATIAATDGEHRVCVTMLNAGPGSNAGSGCRIINAVHPVAPSAPRTVKAVAGFGGATITWTAPASDGGAPWSSYTVTASPGGTAVTVGAGATSAAVTGLADKATYTFAVRAVNVAGASAAGVSPAITTLPAPPPQTTPAPISTSRYIRNIHGASSTDLNAMRAEGAADAKANPSGHGYLILLDIGGQDSADGGVVLSATTRFISYTDLVSDLNAYVDGYHSAQRTSAPVTIAIGTNNDMDVTSTSGAAWADRVVDPVASHAGQYVGMTIAGANDIEPGFRGSYTATKSWMLGYLGATKAPFVFNGSADGCSWTATARSCNNGWTMSGLYYLAAGASPVRMMNLPQIYNTTMAAQWKYISLTGIGQKQPRINFGGALTEWTACAQAGGCGSLTGNNAWTALWNNLQSTTALKVGSLPYSTDLRIDK